MMMSIRIVLVFEVYLALHFVLFSLVWCRFDVWNTIPCNEYYMPENCNFTAMDLVTVDDYDRCGPAHLRINARNYFLAASGRRTTYKRNKIAFDRIQILPKMLRDVSNNSIRTSALGLEVASPIGLSPVALQKLASPRGEIDTVTALNGSRSIMVVSSFASSSLEQVAAAVQVRGLPHLWMQTYVFRNRSQTLDIVQRAERAGFRAIVLTSDAPVDATLTCDVRHTVQLPSGVGFANFEASKPLPYDVATFKDIAWLRQNSKLPIVAKGILTEDDANSAFLAGATAILVSNHGGRQMDGAPASVDALVGVVTAARKFTPPREVFVDGGVRSGHDVYKALARGARMAFVGRPQVWGLAVEGSPGVRKIFEYLKKDFNETMLIAGSATPAEISADTLYPSPTSSAKFDSFDIHGY